MEKRGLSPVIATVLLVAMVIVIGLIIFLWVRGFQGEAITKFEGTNIELICQEVTFEASYSNGMLYLSNLGNIPIFEMQAKISKDGSHETLDFNDISNWPETGLPRGSVFSEDLSSSFSGAEKVVLIPVLRGTSKSGEKRYVCEEQYGKEIQV